MEKRGSPKKNNRALITDRSDKSYVEITDKSLLLKRVVKAQIMDIRAQHIAQPISFTPEQHSLALDLRIKSHNLVIIHIIFYHNKPNV